MNRIAELSSYFAMFGAILASYRGECQRQGSTATNRNWRVAVRCLAFAVLFTSSLMAARAGVTAGTIQVSVQSDAFTEDGTHDPKDASSGGPQISVSSDVGVASASARGALVAQAITNGFRFGGNAVVNASGTSGSQGGVAGAVALCNFTVSGATHSWRLTGQLAASSGPSGRGNAQFTIVSKQEAGDVLISRGRIEDNGIQPLDRSGQLAPGSYQVTVSCGFSSGGLGSAETSNFFQLDVIEDQPPPPPPPPPDDGTAVQWDNAAGGSFQTAANWDPESVPGSGDVVDFGLQSAYTVNVGTAATSRLVVRNGAVTFTNLNYTLGGTSFDRPSILLNNASLILANGTLRGVHALIGQSAASRVEVNADATWTNTGSLRVGGPGEGILAIADGGFVTSGEGRIGTGVGGGDVILAGFNAEWESGNLAVGFSGVGTLTIADGARVTSGKGTVGLQSSASGMVSIEGTSPAGVSSVWKCTELIVGEAGAGDVTVRNGGELSLTGKTTVNDTMLIENGGRSVHNSQPLVVGELGIGEVTVRGANAQGVKASMTSVGDLTIGHTRGGFLTIDDDGSARGVGGASVGVNAPGEVFVKGSNSALDLQGDLSIGVTNNGKVDLVGGARIGAHDVVLGVNPGSVGKFTIGDGAVGDPSNLLAAGRIFVGLEGSGTLIIEEDGLVVCAEGRVGGFGGSQGVVELGVTGASGNTAGWIVHGNLTVGGGGSGRIRLRNNAFVGVDGQLTVLPNGVVDGIGILAAPSRLVQNGGFIDPGLSPGTLTIDANYEQTSSGSLRMQAAGLGAGQFDVLHVTGTATLGGTMEVTFLDGYLPKAGDALPFLQVDGAVSGAFAKVTFPQLAPGFEFETQMVNGKLQLTALNDAVRLFARGISQALLAGNPVGHETAGLFTLRTSARGGFSARFILGGRRFALSGKFDAAGKFTETIPRRGDSPLTVSFELSAADPRLVTGTIIDGERTIAISTDRANAFNARTNPAPQAGKYTSVLQFDAAAADAPKANGIGVAAVSKSGAVRFAGMLPDGTRLSQSTVLSESGEWPLYVVLYKKQGSLFGKLQFRNQAGSDFDGTLQWSRPPVASGKLPTPGFLASLPTLGSRYFAPPQQPAILNLANGGIATLRNPDLTTLLIRNLMLTPLNRFVVTDPGADKFSLVAKTATGLLSGRFSHPTTGLSTKIQGVVFQKQNFASGFFVDSGKPGSLEVRPNP